MQKIVYIYDNSITEVNDLLKEGWKIISISPVSVAQGKPYSIAAYVILEEVDTTITPYISSKSQTVDINVNIKEKPYVVSHYSF